ncbi:MAG: HD domain-containing phosphohydrolase, partial [Pyrinomonadaceae bacterium]
GEEIDLTARIFAVADAFDAMTSDRVYRKGRSYEEALEELDKCAGAHFDPTVVEAFHRVPREDWEELRRRSLIRRPGSIVIQALVEPMLEPMLDARAS